MTAGRAAEFKLRSAEATVPWYRVRRCEATDCGSVPARRSTLARSNRRARGMDEHEREVVDRVSRLRSRQLAGHYLQVVLSRPRQVEFVFGRLLRFEPCLDKDGIECATPMRLPHGSCTCRSRAVPMPLMSRSHAFHMPLRRRSRIALVLLGRRSGAARSREAPGWSVSCAKAPREGHMRSAGPSRLCKWSRCRAAHSA